MSFSIKYFLWFLILLFIEVFIALFVHDAFIRPYFGDVLVVILIYTFLKSFLSISVEKAIIIVLIISFTIEFTQLFHLITLLNLDGFTIAHWVLGSSFNLWDFLAYSTGLGLVFAIEKWMIKQ